MSYFVELEPGIKVHVLEIGEGFPVFLQHGSPASGFLYRKVAEMLSTDRLRIIMPTLAGLGFSSKIPPASVLWIPMLLMISAASFTTRIAHAADQGPLQKILSITAFGIVAIWFGLWIRAFLRVDSPIMEHLCSTKLIYLKSNSLGVHNA